jgi:cytochrome c oxidase cbb3-type subunit 4
MSAVKQLELAISIGPTLVTILFVTIFLGTLVWIFRPGSKRFYDERARLPLEDDPSLDASPREQRAPGVPRPQR